MGIYIDPPIGSKEGWLMANAQEAFSSSPSSVKDREDMTLVCLVVNARFTAAAVIYDDRELDAFTLPDDLRHRVWFWVDPEKVKAVCPAYARLRVR